MKIRDFKAKDIYTINTTIANQEIQTTKLGEFLQYCQDYAYLIKTGIDEKGKVLFIGAVTAAWFDDQPIGTKTGEVVFIMSQEFTDNFLRYGKSFLNVLNKEIHTLGLDFLIATCYNSNERGKKLLRRFGLNFKTSGSNGFDLYLKENI